MDRALVRTLGESGSGSVPDVLSQAPVTSSVPVSVMMRGDL